MPDPTAALAEPPYPAAVELVRAAARRDPQRIAVSCAGDEWTYADLWSLAARSAGVLARADVGMGSVVAIHATKRLDFVAALLTVLGSGAVAVPIDASLPTERKRAMIDESGADAVAETVAGQCAWRGEQPCIDVRTEALAAAPESATWPVAVAPDAPAYVFFTSGTSGRPKAILGSHKGLAHFIAWELAELAVCADDRIAQVTSLSFDAMLRDVFVSLAAGGSVRLPGPDELEDPSRMLRWLESERVTIVHTAPSVLAAWAAAPRPHIELRRLRAVCLAGEPLTRALVQRWRAAFPPSNAAVLNLYGPSETTMIKSCYRVPDDAPAGVLPIGAALPDTQLLVLDGERLCDIGEAGEIAIRTPFRTLGYLNAPAEQAARFVPSPFTDDPGDLLYLTGDLGHYEPDGSLRIGGRIDDELKINGVRVQPAEVAALLGAHPSVAACAVLASHAPEDAPSLTAFFVAAEGATHDATSLRTYLSQRLPAALVPSRIAAVAAIPLSPNGKVDRAALLAALGRNDAPVPAAMAPRTVTEQATAAIWADLLGVESIGLEDSFFELGGHSLLAMSMIASVRDATGVQVPLRSVFEAERLGAFARELDRLREDAGR